jgi:hypothetical protein
LGRVGRAGRPSGGSVVTTDGGRPAASWRAGRRARCKVISVVVGLPVL